MSYNNNLKIQMEFPTNINKYLKVNDQGFIICTGKTLLKQLNPHFVNEGTKMLNEIINELGQNSAKSQGLKQIITTYIKFQGCDHRIYLKVQGNKAIGFLRTGEKKLFYHDNIGQIRQLNPVCVLDIYVHESYQRTGIGKEIFETFLKHQNKMPQKLAYDRPSPKLIAFLKKHYGLSKFIPQNNNFVIFDQYFTSSNTTFQTKQIKNDLPNNQLNNTNRFYKHENKKTIQIKTPIQNKQINRTLPLITNKEQTKPILMKGQKIQDSLSLLQKQMNRMHLNSTVTALSAKQIKKQSELPINATKRPNVSNFGCPWATEQNIGFRTTSGSYGSHYNRYK